MGCLGALLGLSRACLGVFGALLALLGLSWALLGLSWAILGLSWGFLGLSWGFLGLSWGCLGLSWAFLGLSWAVSGFLGAVLGLLELLREPTPLKNYCSRLFSGSWTGKTSIHWVAASSQSNRQPATCGQEARPVSRKRVDPAALPLGSQRSRTQTAFSRWRRLALAEIHGVESPKPGAEIGFSEFCTTPIRNARFLHKWPSGLQAGGVSRHAGPVLWLARGG